jgi:hypothetical protein
MLLKQGYRNRYIPGRFLYSLSFSRADIQPSINFPLFYHKYALRERRDKKEEGAKAAGVEPASVLTGGFTPMLRKIPCKYITVLAA